MNKKLQQRLVGSIAVLGLLILVLPHLFSSNEHKFPEPTVPPTNTTSTTQGQSTPPVITVDPITEITDTTVNNNVSSTDPISESTWESVTDHINTVNANSDLSVAEQLLADINKIDTSHTTTSQPSQLPKIELIGSSQTKSSTKTQNTTHNATPKFTWFVQVGSYSSKENANKAMLDYKKKGYSSEVAYLSGQYKVRIGPLKTQDNAKNVQSELKRNGVNSYIIQIQ